MKWNKAIVRFAAYLAAAALVVGGLRMVVLSTPRYQVMKAFQNTMNSTADETTAWNPPADACIRQNAAYTFEEFSVTGGYTEFSLADLFGETKLRVDQVSDPAENTSRTEIGIRFEDCEEWGVDLYMDGSGQMIMGLPGMMAEYLEMPAESMSRFSMVESLDPAAAQSMAEDLQKGYLEIMTKCLDQASYKKLGSEALSLADRTAAKYQVTFDEKVLRLFIQQLSEVVTSNSYMVRYMEQMGYDAEDLTEWFEELAADIQKDDSLTLYVYVSDGYMVEIQYAEELKDGPAIEVASGFLGEKNVTDHVVVHLLMEYEGESIGLDMEMTNENGTYDFSMDISVLEEMSLQMVMTAESSAAETGMNSKLSNLEFTMQAADYEIYIKGNGTSETYLEDGVSKPEGNILNMEEMSYSDLSAIETEIQEALYSGRYLPMSLVHELFEEEVDPIPGETVNVDIILQTEDGTFEVQIPAPEGTACVDYTDGLSAMFMDDAAYSVYYYELVDLAGMEEIWQEYSDLFVQDEDMLDWYTERQSIQLNGYDVEYAAYHVSSSGVSMLQGVAYVILDESYALNVVVSLMEETPLTEAELLAAMETAFQLELPITKPNI